MWLFEIKDFKKRSKKATSLITQSIDDSIVMSLDVHVRNRVHMWAQFIDDYNTITEAQRSAARKGFLNFFIIEGENFLDIKQKLLPMGSAISADHSQWDFSSNHTSWNYAYSMRMQFILRRAMQITHDNESDRITT